MRAPRAGASSITAREQGGLPQLPTQRGQKNKVTVALVAHKVPVTHGGQGAPSSARRTSDKAAERLRVYTRTRRTRPLGHRPFASAPPACVRACIRARIGRWQRQRPQVRESRACAAARHRRRRRTCTGRLMHVLLRRAQARSSPRRASRRPRRSSNVPSTTTTTGSVGSLAAVAAVHRRATHEPCRLDHHKVHCDGKRERVEEEGLRVGWAARALVLLRGVVRC
jgi:hypothetical protein